MVDQQGQRLPIGSAAGGALAVLHTPGHSGGSVCLCVHPADGGPMHSVVVGDMIFPGSCGRLALPDSSTSDMFASLQKMKALPDNLPGYPGHGYSGDKTTILQEKRNGLLRDFSKAQWMQMHG